MTTYEANPATDTARYTFTRKRGDVLELVALYSNPEDHRDTRNVVVGTTTEAPVKMFVGRKAMIHDGTQYTHTITVDHKVSRGGDGDPRRANLHRAGDVLVTEPYNCCGASGMLKSYGFARNTNHVAPADAAVTCSKCLKRAAKRA